MISVGGDNIIKLRTATSSKKDIKNFLKNVSDIISNESFDINTDFQIILTKQKDDPLSIYTTQNTLLDLNYDTTDVLREIQSLTVEDYSETMIDDKRKGFNLLHVFGKLINGKEVYIKIGFKKEKNDVIFCISFHYSKYKMNYPYA